MEFNFKKIHTGKDLVISSLIMLAGIGLYFVNSALGVFIAAVGFLMLLCWKTGYALNGRTDVFKKQSVDLCRRSKPSLLAFLNGSSQSLVVEKGNEGGTVILTVYYNEKQKLAFAQLFDYVEGNAVLIADGLQVNSPKYEKLMSLLS